MLFNIAYLTLICNTLSSFENNRYRLPIDGFYLVLLGMALDRIWSGRRGGGAHLAPPSPDLFVGSGGEGEVSRTA
jgi:hypothetical protein